MKKIAILVGIILIVAIYLTYSGFRSKTIQPGKASPPMDVSATQNQQAGDREPQSVEIPPEKQQLIGIKTAEVKVLSLKKTLRTIGRVEFDERKLTTVNVKVEGWVEKLYADYTGKYVKKGEPLAEIYSPELMSTQLEFLNLLEWKKDKSHRFQRNIEFEWGDRYGTTGKMITFDIDALIQVAKQKLALWEIPEAEIKALEEGKEPLRTLTVRAPSSGYVFQKPAFKGTRVAPGDKIFDVVDLSSVWVIADIYEYEIPFVKIGQKARIILSYFPEKEFIAKVDFIYPSLSGQTRTARARFVIPNPGMLLKPQMFANVEMELDLGERLAIPATAILDTGTRQVVYVDIGDGYFTPRQVRLGVRTDGIVEVTNGLKAGEKVASMAVFLIDSEAKLKGVSQ
jgi:Cu(I)/Ag(I) efflux system membrane fusion protein